MNRLYVLLLLSLTPSLSLGQARKSAITADFLGNTLVGVNAHRSLGKLVDYTGKQIGFYDLSLGIGYFNDQIFTLPHGLTANLGSHGNYAEFGYAGTYFFRFSQPTETANTGLTSPGLLPCGCVQSGPAAGMYNPTLLIGYRRQADSGFVLRAYGAVGLTNSAYYETFWRVMPGLSVGWSF